MTPQSVGLSGSQLTIGKLSGRRGLQGKLQRARLRRRGRGARRRSTARRSPWPTPRRRSPTRTSSRSSSSAPSEVPASVALVGWSVTSSHGGNATGTRLAHDRRRGARGRGDRQRPGQRAVRRGRRRAPAGPRLAPDADRVRDQGRVAPARTPRARSWSAAGARRTRARARSSSPATGLSTNIIEASLEAYLVAVNKLHGAEINGVAVAFVAPRTGRGAAMTDERRPATLPRRRRSRATASGRRSSPPRGASSTRPARGSASTSTGPSTSSAAPRSTPTASPIRDEDLAACGAADAILLGAVGGPKWSDPNAAVRPGAGPLRAARRARPVRQPAPGHASSRRSSASSPLRPELLAGVDMLIVRELTGGLYFGDADRGVGRAGRPRRRSTRCPTPSTRSRRIVRLAFELARGRRGRRDQVDKANVLATSRLWRRVADEVAAEYPDVELNHQLVDSCAMLLIRRPADFDVIVTENLFGDILSDEAAVLAGSLGHAAVGLARRAPDRARPFGPVRADPRLRAGHRRPRHRQPDRHDPVGGDARCAASLGRADAADGDRGGRRRAPWTTAGGRPTWPTRPIRPTGSWWSARPRSRRPSSRRSSRRRRAA